jgi:tetratricopeptide (TPR) repeat protein
MEEIYKDYKEDKEAAIFYALALTATADPTDKTFVTQKKAGAILDELYKTDPNHPGVVHYIIHAYDSPELAALGLTAARQYASVAPSSAHALHMPSHIFTRLGLWDECIQSNLNSVTSAKCYAEEAGLKGHWDEELHGVDYLIYAYLQKGDLKQAKQQWDYLKSIERVEPVNFKVAYAFASIPSRYLMENRMWEEAAKLEYDNKIVPWKDYPWQRAMFHFTRLMGSVHLNKLDLAKAELKQLRIIHDTLLLQKDAYKASQVEIEAKTGEAWILFKEGKDPEAIQLMTAAAELEEKTEKHPVTPGAIIPARELLGDMYLAMNRPAEALAAYEADLKRQPKRLNGVKGALEATQRLPNVTNGLASKP